MKKAKIGGSAMGLTHDQDPLNQYAKRGKPHPRVVLEAVLELMDMQDQVQTADDLLKPTQDNAVRGAQAVAMHLFGDKQVLGLTPAVIARMFNLQVTTVTTFQMRIVTQLRENADFRSRLESIIAAIKAKDKRQESTAEDADDADGADDGDDGTGGEANDDGSYAEMDTRLGGTKATIRARIIAYKQRAMRLLEQHGYMSPGQLSAALDIDLHRLHNYMEELLEDYSDRLTVSGERSARRYSLDGRTEYTGAADEADVAEAAEHRDAPPAAAPRRRGPGRPPGRKPGRPSKADARGKRAAAHPERASIPDQGAAFVPMQGLMSMLAGGAASGGQDRLVALTPAGQRELAAFYVETAADAAREGAELILQGGQVDKDKLRRARRGALAMHVLLESVVPQENVGGGSDATPPVRKTKKK